MYFILLDFDRRVKDENSITIKVIYKDLDIFLILHYTVLTKNNYCFGVRDDYDNTKQRI